MATFQAQIEGLTGLAITGSSNPTQTELTQFLTDGAKDVINRISKLDSSKMPLFSTSTTDSDDSGVVVDSGLILDVVRADGTLATSLNPASRINSNLRYRATNSNSLSFRSNFHPCYYLLDGKVYIVPAPSNSTTNKAIVSYVSYPTIAFGDSSIGGSYSSATVQSTTKANPCVLNSTAHGFSVGNTISLSDFTEMTELNGITSQVATVPDANSFTLEGIDSTNYAAVEATGGFAETVVQGFADEYEYLVVIYAAIKTLEAKMAEFAIDEEDEELVRAITSNLTSLKQEYNGAFAPISPPQPQQAAQGGR